MPTTKNSKKELLRQRAEKLLSDKPYVAPRAGDKDVKKLIHELQVHQIELEMQNEELRKAQAEIEESRTKYSDLHDFSPVGYFTFSQTGEIVEVNLTGASLLGVERTKLLQRSFSAFVDPKFRSLFRGHRLNVLKNGGKERCELKLIKKDGKSFYASVESISVRQGKSLRIRSAVSDITELRNAQEKAETEHAFRIAIENSILSGIAAVDLEGRQSYVNLGFCRMVGRSEEELLGRKPPFAYWPPEELDHINRVYHTVMDGKAPRGGIQLRFTRKNGERFDALYLPSPLKDHQGKVIGWIGTFGDITHLKQMEKDLKQLNTQLEERVRQRTAELENANQELRQSESKFRVLADNTYDMEFWISPEGRFVFMSPSCKRITGHDADKFMEDSNLLRSIVDPEDLPAFDRHRQEEEEEEVPPREFEFRIIRADGSVQWIGHVCQHIFDQEGRFLGIRGSNRSITKRKEAEEALRESRERYRSLATNMPSVLMRYDKNLRVLFLSPKSEEITGVPIQKFIGKTNKEVQMPEHLRLLWDNSIQEVFRAGKSKDLEFDFQSRKGTKTFYLIFAPEFGPEGEVKHVSGIATDITKRKQMERALKESEERLRFVLETCHIGAWDMDIADHTTIRSPEHDRIYGYDVMLPQWTYEMFLEHVLPEDRARVHATYQHAVKTQSSWSFEYRIRRPDGKVRWIWAVGGHKRDPDGAIRRVAGIVQDITERKQMEEDLCKSRDELEIRVQERTAEIMDAVEALQDEMSERKRIEEVLIEQSRILEGFFTSTITPLVFLDKDFKFIRVNEAYAKVCQRDISEFAGHNHFEFYPQEENEAIFKKVVETKTPYRAFAKPFSFPDHPEWGVTYWDWTLTPLLDDKGEVEFLVFSLEDVTEQEQAEEALREASRYNRSLIEVSLDPVVTIDADGKVTDVNKATESVTGFTRDRLIGSDFSDYFTEPDKAEKGYLQVFLSGAVKDYPLAIRHTSGKVIDVLYNATLYRNEAGEIRGIFAAARDITEIKEVQRRAEATNSLLNLFVRKTTRREYLDSVIELIQPWSGCRCVGIRILNEKDYIPYESYVGFGREFWESENLLSVKYDQCACIRVVTGNPDPQDQPVMTPAGSFRCENTFEFIDRLSKEEKGRFRGTCINNGFKSVAIVPIRYQEKMLGAIHLADEGEGKVPASRVEFIESMAPLIGEAINRFNLEEELKDSETRLRYLSSQLLTVQENERRSIARELHDGVGQMLTAVKFKIESALQLKSKKKSLEAVIPLIKESIEEVRRVQMDLRPSTLDDLGVLATLEWFCREYQKIYSHIRIEKKTGLKESDVPMPIKTVIYRVTQEALNNIAKHSKANLVRLSLSKKENKIELTIRDDGMGFDLEQTLDREGSRRGLGLTSMSERTQLSGGFFVIESTPGKGTTLRANWTI